MTNTEFRSRTKSWRLAALHARGGKPLPHWALFEQSRHSEVDPSGQGTTATPSDKKEKCSRAHQCNTEDEDFWRETLQPIEFRILRENGWDQRASSLYVRFFPDAGYFACRACGLPLFTAESKFESPAGSLGPSFGCCIEENVRAVPLQNEQNHSSQKRADIQCARCRSNLGNVRAEHFPTRKNSDVFFRERHAVNGLAVSYVKGCVPKNCRVRNVVLHHPPVILVGEKPVSIFE